MSVLSAHWHVGVECALAARLSITGPHLLACWPADTLIVYAKTRPEAGPHGITAFIVEKGMQAGRREGGGGLYVWLCCVCWGLGIAACIVEMGM